MSIQITNTDSRVITLTIDGDAFPVQKALVFLENDTDEDLVYFYWHDLRNITASMLWSLDWNVVTVPVGLANSTDLYDAIMAMLMSGLGDHWETEIPAGAINDINTVYTTSVAYGKIRVYKNGIRQTPTVSYTETSDTTITMTTPPSGGADPDIILVDILPQ